MAVNLGSIENRLNSDLDFRNKFLQDPIAALKEEGLELSPEMAGNMQNFVRQLSEPPAQIAGSNVTAAPEETRIMINIGKSF